MSEGNVASIAARTVDQSIDRTRPKGRWRVLSRAAFDPLGIANPGKMFPEAGAPALTQHGLHPLEKAGVISRE